MRRWEKMEPAPIVPGQSKTEMKWTIGFLTPMFGGGVFLDTAKHNKHLKKPDDVTPIRVSSIRGQLRFWWRAAIGSKMGTIADMREREAALFGSTGNRATVEIRIDGPQPRLSAIEASDSLGYGTFPLRPEQGARTPEGIVPPNGKLYKVSNSFELVVTCDPIKTVVDDVTRAVETWLALGGLGGRTRRGFGALNGGTWDLDQVLDLGNGDTIPEVPSLVGAMINHRKKPNSLADSDAAHKLLLSKLKDFRQGYGIGRNSGPGRSFWPEPDTIRSPALMNQYFKDAHDPEKSHKPVHKVNAFPRGLFGMPIIFHFHRDNTNRNNPRDPVFDPPDTTLIPDGLTPSGKPRERLASPLILRPWRDPKTEPSNKECFAVAVVLTDPARKSLFGNLCYNKKNINKSKLRINLTASEASWTNSPLNGEPDPLIAFLNFF